MSNIEIFDYMDTARMVDDKIIQQHQCIRCNLCNYSWLDAEGEPINEGDRLIPIPNIPDVIDLHIRKYHTRGDL